MKKTNKNVNLNKQKIDFKEILKQIQKRDDGAFFGQCVKFKDNAGDVATVDRAVQFLWLKDNNVGRNEALHFGKRRICKIDSTKQFDGPISARIMPTQKLHQGVINGWHNGASDPKYKLGDDFKTEITKNIDNQQYDDFAKHEKKELQETQKNLDYIQRFYEELIEKYKQSIIRYNFGGKNTQKLHHKLQELREANRQRNNTPLEYVEHQGQRFFHILNDITDYLDKKIENKTILHEMHAFQSLTSLDKKLKIKFLPLGDPMVPTEKELNIIRQSSIALNSETLQSYRKRACTQLFSQQYNKKNRVFQIQQVPTMIEQQKQNKQNNIIEGLQRNGMNTPKEVDEGDQTYRNRKSKYGTTDFQFTQLSKKTINSLRSKSNRASPIRRRGTTIDDERTNVLEQRINRYVKGHLNSQHNSAVIVEVDNNNLKDKYQQLLSVREKEYNRIYGKNKEISCNDNILYFLKQ